MVKSKKQIIMRKINSRANTNETAEACVGVVELSKKHPIVEDPYYSVTFGILSDQTESIIGKINAGWLTNELREIDELRDTDVKALFYEVEAKCMRRSDANQEKAMRVLAILDRYGMKIVGSSYTNESAQVRAMLSDLKAPELVDAIASNPELSTLMNNLEGSQAGFDIASGKFIEGKLERGNTKPASVIAKELKDTFNDKICI